MFVLQHGKSSRFCYSLGKKSRFHQRTTHIDVEYHFIQSMEEEGTLNIVYIDTTTQLADALAKSLSEEKFLKFKHDIGTCSAVVALNLFIVSVRMFYSIK